MFKEIEDPGELARYSAMLTKKLKRQLSRRIEKTIGYPSGRATVDVNFEPGVGDHLLWWSSEKSENGEAMINLIGRGNPEASAYLLIDLQFNVPIKKFGRSHGGSFVQDVESGAVLLAHRGIVTRGKSRVPKDLLFREASIKTTSVVTEKGEIDLLLVASLDSENLLEDLSSFAQEMRRAAETVMGGAGHSKKPAVKAGAELDARLGAYFEEFSGKRRISRRQAVIFEVRHGSVVKELKIALESMGDVLKSQQVDLAIRKSKNIWVFEVKTSVRSTDLYTAIGQLSLHALAAGDQFPGSSVRKILVITHLPKPSILRKFEDHLGIDIVTYSWTGKSRVSFDEMMLQALTR